MDGSDIYTYTESISHFHQYLHWHNNTKMVMTHVYMNNNRDYIIKETPAELAALINNAGVSDWTP